MIFELHLKNVFKYQINIKENHANNCTENELAEHILYCHGEMISFK